MENEIKLKQFRFPTKYHNPVCVAADEGAVEGRWFFAQPNCVVEVALLRVFFSLTCRGGATASALHESYLEAFCTVPRPDVTEDVHVSRPNFIQVMEPCMVVWAAVRMLARATPQALKDIPWTLHGKMTDGDLQTLVAPVRAAFEARSLRHSCRLFQKHKTIVMDGKWCMHTALYAERASYQVVSEELSTGYFCGCLSMPLKGKGVKKSVFCKAHQLTDTAKPDAHCNIESSRTAWIPKRKRLAMQYEVEGRWVGRSEVSREMRRLYERGLRRKGVGASKAEGENGSWKKRTKAVIRDMRQEKCGRDPRRGTPEELVARKTSGVLAAVCTCHHIFVVQPMCGD